MQLCQYNLDQREWQMQSAMCQYNVDQREWELKELGTNVGAGSPWSWNPMENPLTVLRNFATHGCRFLLLRKLAYKLNSAF
jgi:hypothetical protein